mgnify:CR=1 FL=1
MDRANRSIEGIAVFRQIEALEADGKLSAEEAGACRVALAQWYGLPGRGAPASIADRASAPPATASASAGPAAGRRELLPSGSRRC